MSYVRGTVARQAHVAIPEGTVEEEIARDGFFGRASHLYRRHAPVGWTRIEGELRPRAYQASELAAPGRDWTAIRTGLLEGDGVRLSLARLDGAMPYTFRNADADEVLFVHQGRGRFESDFGAMGYETGHYVVVPRGVSYRLDAADHSTFLVVETASEVKVPDRGLLGRHALFDPEMCEVPDVAQMPPPRAGAEHELRVQRGGAHGRLFYPFDPLDTVGWKGDLAPFRLHVSDIRPVSSERYHLPPTAHATFVAGGVVICTFLPRPLETGDPLALRVPFYHANVDYDEVLFYHRGSFFSRAGVGPGMVTFHPAGIHHGPQPGAVKAAATKERTDEVAVMIDTRSPLRPCSQAPRVENVDYWKSWQEK
ncbi:MAG: homogentisate 1,2-dioxygenase [Sandaracinus sp.]